MYCVEMASSFKRSRTRYKTGKKTKKYSLINIIITFFVCFPFIMFINLGTDMQPYALLFSGLYFVYLFLDNKILINKEFIVLLLTIIFISIFSIVDGLSFLKIRGAVNYANIFIISIVSLYAFKKYGEPQNLFKIFIWIWFIVGLIQTLIYRDFLSFIISGHRTTDGRGVYGLASEPSFYGIMMIFFMFFVKDFKKNKLLYLLLCIVQIILFAQSSYAILLLVLFVVMYIIGDIQSTQSKIKIFIALVVLCIFGIVFFKLFLPNSRVSSLITMFFSGRIFYDQSVIERFQSITVSFEKFFSANMMPQGFNERIMSGFGAVLVEIGIFGLPMIIIICSSVSNAFSTQNKFEKFLIAILFFIFMLGAIQLSHTMVAMIVGYGWYKKSRYCKKTAVVI